MCIPACTGQGVCVYPSMHWAGGRLPGGKGPCLGGGVPAWELCIPACTEADNPPPPWTEFLTHASETRMHSSRMRTACLLTVPQHALPGGVPAQGVYLPGGVPAQGSTCPGTPLPCEQNDRQLQKYYLAPNFVCGR